MTHPAARLSFALLTLAATTADAGSDRPVDEDMKLLGLRLGAHFEVDAGILVVMRQGTAILGGATLGPWRVSLGYASFLSNSAFGGTPAGFTMRVNSIVSVNAAYFLFGRTHDGPYVQAMLHVKEQGITDDASGDHVDLDSLASGLELGWAFSVFRGLYLAPRVGALSYLKSPQGPSNAPVRVGGRAYDNERHKVWDTYFIPTLSVGYAW